MEEEIIETIPQRKSLRGLKAKFGKPREQKVQMQHRFTQLFALFAVMDADHDKRLTFSEFSTFLLNKTSGMFDEEFTAELFGLMDKNRDSSISREEFTSTFVEAELLILQRIEQQREVIEKLRSSGVLDGEKQAKKEKEIAFWESKLTKLRIN